MLPDADIGVCDVTREALPFPDNSIDVVYHKSVIEHMFDPLPLMRETMRVLKPGGKVIVLTPDWQTQMATFFEDFTHCRPYDTTALGDLFKVIGLAESFTERFAQLPVLWRHRWLSPVSAVVRFFVPVVWARRLTDWTGWKFIRWSSELMVLGYGIKRE